MPLPEDRDKLVIENIWLVKSIVKKICKIVESNELFEDLMQEGTIGLIRAVDLYDATKGAKLSTYAYRWIRGSIFNFLNKHLKYGIIISRLRRDCAKKILRANDDLMRKLKRKPTIEEIAEAATLSFKEVEEGLDLLEMTIWELSEINQDDQRAFDSPEESTIRKAKIELVMKAVEQIAPDRKRTLMLRYFEDLSHKEIAKKMDKTEGAVKVLVHRALEDLRSLFDGGFGRENPQK